MAKSTEAKRANGAAITRKRGRPPTESPHERLVRLEREIAATRAAVREDEQRKLIIVGAAVAAEAEANPAFKAQLAEVLSRRVTSAAAKADIAPLVCEQPARGGLQPHSPHQGEHHEQHI